MLNLQRFFIRFDSMTALFSKNVLPTVLFLTIAASGSLAAAQHHDIEFDYDNGKIDIEFGPEGAVYEAELPTSGSFEQATDDPGIASEVAEGLGVNPGDVIDYQILGPLQYHNGTSFAPVPAGVSLSIGDNPSGGLTVDASTAGPVSGTGIIAIADGIGDVHTHVEFSLNPLSLGVSEYGAYGLLTRLTTDEPGIAPSDPFYIVLNFGLDEETFEESVEAFAANVPEPTALVLTIASLLSLSCIRKEFCNEQA
jgi:hypothetical protein